MLICKSLEKDLNKESPSIDQANGLLRHVALHRDVTTRSKLVNLLLPRPPSENERLLDRHLELIEAIIKGGIASDLLAFGFSWKAGDQIAPQHRLHVEKARFFNDDVLVLRPKVQTLQSVKLQNIKEDVSLLKALRKTNDSDEPVPVVDLLVNSATDTCFPFYIISMLQQAQPLTMLLDNFLKEPNDSLLARLNIAHQMLECVEFCHGRGVLLRDIACECFQVQTTTADGMGHRIQLTDLCLAKQQNGLTFREKGKFCYAYFNPTKNT